MALQFAMLQTSAGFIERGNPLLDRAKRRGKEPKSQRALSLVDESFPRLKRFVITASQLQGSSRSSRIANTAKN
jgi:hypothetical protein